MAPSPSTATATIPGVLPRPTRSRTRASYPRKRALVACETCRRRKIKCDNDRPTCGACRVLGTACTFQSTHGDHSTYDLASLEILARVNHVAALLEAQARTIPAVEAVQGPAVAAVHGSLDADADGVVEALEFTGRRPGSCEQILGWPILAGKHDAQRITCRIFRPTGRDAQLSTTPLQRADSVRPSPASGRGVREDDAPRLANRFLINVHIKNPVLDPDELKAAARGIAENGFGWDTTSCLLLIVCALASLSSGFAPEAVTPSLVEPAGPRPLRSVDDTPDYATAESYYMAAQKRVGLLDSSVGATQCLFLLGVYEMYSLRPAAAWTSFHRACVALQMCFRGDSSPTSDQLVCRLYWSCLKSECELRMEMDLPSSGLASAAYPDVFPTPPSPGGDTARTEADGGRPPRGLEPDLEKIWSYYLSELAVRKIANRIMNCFYRDGEAAWLAMSLDRMIRVAEELELQITQWFDNLPGTLTATDAAETHIRLAAEELTFVLHARLADLRERIYRPFLYLAVSRGHDDLASQTAIAPYVQRCVDACLAFLLRGTPRHRHHGTWYENRSMFLKSLLLLSAVKSGRVYVPEDAWRHGVALCLAGLTFWEAEAPDLAEARIVLQDLVVGIAD